ncbi:MAG: single-stranded DNA-binding protein [Proteobacteria bacterium]|nr:MAG: single-stranded DNA-binding protein [Pseudomonadota bacterium]
MASVNKVLLIGKLGRDPEMRHTPSGQGVCTLNIATTETWNDNGNKQERTEWHRVTVWGKQGENCAKYLAKGRSVYVEGRLQTRSWDDKDGQKRYSTDIVATTVQFLGDGRTSQPQEGGNLQNFNPPHSEPSPSDSVFGSHNSSSLDDIPF